MIISNFLSTHKEVVYIRRLIVNSAVMVVKFGHMSSDLLAFGASDGTLTVCNVSEPSSSVKQLVGHSKDVTGWIGWYCFFCLLHCLFSQSQLQGLLKARMS